MLGPPLNTKFYVICLAYNSRASNCGFYLSRDTHIFCISNIIVNQGTLSTMLACICLSNVCLMYEGPTGNTFY